MILRRSPLESWFSAGLARARGLEDEAANSALRAIGVPDVEEGDE